MATTSITPTALAFNTMSADLVDGDGTAADTQADGWAVALGDYPTERLLFKFLDDGTGGDVTFKAGDRPPAGLAALGDLVITLAANDVRYIVLEPGRFEQSDDTITVIAEDAGCEIKVFAMPKGGGGGA